MTQQLEDAWVKDIFTTDELKEYAQFEAQLKERATPESKAQFEQEWYALVEQFKGHLKDDPNSAVGIKLGKKMMDWVNKIYGKEYAHLRSKKFEQGFAKGKGLDQHGLTPAIVEWMDKAIDAYWYDRLYTTLSRVGTLPKEEVAQQWDSVLEEMYGNHAPGKQELVRLAWRDDKVSEEAKAWLAQHYPSLQRDS